MTTIEQAWDQIAELHDLAKKHKAMAEYTREKIAELIEQAELDESVAAEYEAKAKILGESKEL